MKQSAGILVYKKKNNVTEVLIVHPGGPFWAKKDKGAWSIPKGEPQEGDDRLETAKREFREETGHEAPNGEFIELGSIKNKSGKVIYAWAVEGDLDASNVKSNTFTMEWPPKSGNQQEFVEVDKAGWFNLEKAKEKLNPAQADFIDRLAEALNVDLSEPPEQTT
ncbi:MAG: NUDIX domain-containing protein, partial [Acidobacteriota bacterium]